MQQAIEKFCQSHEHGLFLLDMPTGFGKTYSVLEFISDNYNKPEYADKKFFFVTTLKKNLPFDKLREHFADRGKEEDYDRLCIKIEANADAVIENLVQVSKKIPPRVKSRQEYRDLYNTIRLLNENKDKVKGKNTIQDEALSIICNNANKTIREQLERAFRRVVDGELRTFRTPKERLKAIQNEPEYQWIGEVYPAVFTREKRIFFMSMDKFILGNSTIIEPTYSFYNNQIIDNAIIFIDEFDATRDRMLNQIIRRGLDNHVDYLTLFNQVHAALKTRDFPTDLTTESKKDQKYLQSNPKSKKNVEIIRGFEKVLDETYEKFSMQYSFRTSYGATGDTDRNFIFNDLQFHSIFSGDNSFVHIETDKKAKQNWLRFIKNRPNEKDGGVLNMLSSVKGCVTYFQNGCRNLSYNYKNLMDDRKRQGDDDYTFENAIGSVLREFHLSREYIHYLTPAILSGQVRSKKVKKESNGKLSLKYFDRSIYDIGFRYYDFVDNPNHNMQSEIELFDFQVSPEHILLKMCARACVIGISATATLDTVVGNYDLEYIERMLQKDYCKLSFDDEMRLRDNFANFTKDYDKINIHVNTVVYKKELLEEMKEVFENEALAKKYKEKLEEVFAGNKYAIDNFVRIVKVLKEFICNDGVKSFLCLSNKLPQDKKGLLDLTLLKAFAKEILKPYGKTGITAEKLIFSINSEDFDAKRVDFIKRLSAGEKLFIVSSYNTIGAGQNLQYPTPNNVGVVKVNDYARGEQEKDFDCIYLERPTNLIVNIDKGISDEDLIRCIFQMEFLMERGEISRKEGIGCIKDAFKWYSGGKGDVSRFKGELYKTSSVNNYALRTLIQAVGRICRTGLKNKDIFIYIDDSIFEKHDLKKVEDRMLNPEFQKIVEVSKQYHCANNRANYEIMQLENVANNLSIKTMRIIEEIMRNWTDDSMDYWRGLRKLCLMKPTMSAREVAKNTQYQNLYLKAPYAMTQYSYEQEGDYEKNITIKFDNSLKQMVSEEAVMLQELFLIPGLKEYFKENHLATKFLADEYLLTPPLFNNIYKGALGEEVGKFLLKRYMNIDLNELDNEELFELFDFTTKDGIYVDFKYWQETMKADVQEQKEKIIRKLEQCGGNRAIIINIMAEREYQITTSYDGKIVEIPYLYRIDKHQIDTVIIQKIQREGYLG